MSPQPDPRRWKALALLCLAFFMLVLLRTVRPPRASAEAAAAPAD
jgi:hypothetical protein